MLGSTQCVIYKAEWIGGAWGCSMSKKCLVPPLYPSLTLSPDLCICVCDCPNRVTQVLHSSALSTYWAVLSVRDTKQSGLGVLGGAAWARNVWSHLSIYLSLSHPAFLNLPLISIACQSSSLLFFLFVCLFVFMGVFNVCKIVSFVVVSFVSLSLSPGRSQFTIDQHRLSGVIFALFHFVCLFVCS